MIPKLYWDLDPHVLNKAIVPLLEIVKPLHVYLKAKSYTIETGVTRHHTCSGRRGHLMFKFLFFVLFSVVSGQDFWWEVADTHLERCYETAGREETKFIISFHFKLCPTVEFCNF